ncbi:membrane protein [Staphylococcus schleiferi]|uniref:Uncharacterized protein n=1 Tax=Staphylococcus coagulans TaxID=74706 RepID=A0A9X1E310_9STAP|nr:MULTISPECIES: hypothetical protein [Staphylococcus]AKS66346.1 membrane protein [Staphylococcus schleiferi]AKS68464.1 membrane protein [Staphylococcus schleiferi]AKS70693.1 membrane protein [Staphylococcus schleiferi]AKS72861.1 membrane protein [Staphylococcus schleiferi]MBA8771324.1 hypothetical protein [Staphylococcus coagulans]
MNERYLKVLGLYFISAAIPALLDKVNSSNCFFKWFTKTVIGYGIFASGLKIMKKHKHS